MKMLHHVHIGWLLGVRLFTRSLALVLVACAASGCASYYYGGTNDTEEPVYVAEHERVVLLYRWQSLRNPSFFDAMGGGIGVVALVRDRGSYSSSDDILRFMRQIPESYVLSRAAGETDTSGTLREQIAKTVTSVIPERHTRWVLSINPLVVAITPFSTEAWYEKESTWSRMYNPPSRLVEERHKRIPVQQYIVLESDGPRVVNLDRAMTLGMLLETQPWRLAEIPFTESGG